MARTAILVPCRELDVQTLPQFWGVRCIQRNSRYAYVTSAYGNRNRPRSCLLLDRRARRKSEIGLQSPGVEGTIVKNAQATTKEEEMGKRERDGGKVTMWL